MEILRRLRLDRLIIKTRSRPQPVDDATADMMLAAMHQRVEAFQVASIANMYIGGEALILDATGQIAEIAGKLPDSISNVDKGRFRFGRARGHTTTISAISEKGVRQILSSISDPDKQRSIHQDGINKAIQYWEITLASPDLKPDQILIGRSRLTQLGATLDRLAGKDQQQHS